MTRYAHLGGPGEVAGIAHLLAGRTLTDALLLVALRHTGRGLEYEGSAAIELPDQVIADADVESNVCRALLTLQDSTGQRMTALMAVLVSDVEDGQPLEIAAAAGLHALAHELTVDVVVQRRGDQWRSLVGEDTDWHPIELTESYVEVAAQRGPLDETPLPDELRPAPLDDHLWEALSDQMIRDAEFSDQDPVGDAFYARLRPWLDNEPSVAGLHAAYPLIGIPHYRARLYADLRSEEHRERLMGWAALAVRSAPALFDADPLRADPLTFWIMGAMLGEHPATQRAIEYAGGICPDDPQLRGLTRTWQTAGPQIGRVALENALDRVARELAAQRGD